MAGTAPCQPDSALQRTSERWRNAVDMMQSSHCL
jgi:hypothetical protein